MRLWTLHPRLLDARGLVALWREGLLAQAVLRGETRGYQRHPQLVRFRASGAPVACIASYLAAVHCEAARRGYRFDRRKVARGRCGRRMRVTAGQIRYEWQHLKAKLAVRDRAWLKSLRRVRKATTHPLFKVVPGPVEEWEVGRERRRVRR